MLANRIATGFQGMFKPVCLLLVLLNFAPLLRVQAQTDSGPGDAQLDRDVQRLLANDDDVAALRKQLGAREITNVEYTKQLQVLQAARKEIVQGYDRTGYQKLIGLYNAAKRDKQIAAAEAARQAAAEARAQAAAEREAARQAAIQEAQEKAAAAKAAAEALAKEVAADAQEAARVQLRRLELNFKQRMGTITPAEQRELQTLGTTAGEIAARYAAGTPLQSHAREFLQQSNQVFQGRHTIAGKEWITEAFPDPKKVADDYSNDIKRGAACKLLSDVLGNMVGRPLPGFTTEKIMEYGRVAGKADFQKSLKLAQEDDFQIEVFQKYLPGLVPEVQARIRAEKQAAEFKAAQDKIIARGKFVSGLLTLLFIAILAGALFWTFRTKHARVEPSVSGDSLQLPDELALVKVFRKEYPVKFEAGIVYEKEMWTETNVSTTTSGGGSYVSGGAVYSNPVHTTTHVSTTVYHRYWVRTPEGTETWYRFADDVFPASKGNIISVIGPGTSIQAAYNHSTGQFAALDAGIRGAHYLKTRWIILSAIGVWCVASLAITSLFGAGGSGRSSDFVWAGALGMGFILCIVMLILKIVFVTTRNRQFKSRYVPQFRQFMESRTSELTKRLPASMMQPVQPA